MVNSSLRLRGFILNMNVYTYPLHSEIQKSGISKKRFTQPLPSIVPDVFFGTSYSTRREPKEMEFNINGTSVPCVAICQEKTAVKPPGWDGSDTYEDDPFWHEAYLSEFESGLSQVNPTWLRLALAGGYAFYFFEGNKLEIPRAEYIPIQLPASWEGRPSFLKGATDSPQRIVSSIEKACLEAIFDKYDLAHRKKWKISGPTLLEAYIRDEAKLQEVAEGTDPKSVFVNYLMSEDKSWLRQIFPATTSYIDDVLVPAMNGEGTCALAVG